MMKYRYRSRKLPIPIWEPILATTLLLGYPLLILAILGSLALLLEGNPLPILALVFAALFLIGND